MPEKCADSEKIAFFDADHTLISCSSGACFLLEAYSQGLVPVWRLLAIPVLYAGYIFRKIEWDSWDDAIPGIGGVHRDVLLRIAGKAWTSRFRSMVFPGMEERVASLKNRGIPVWIATSSVDFLVEPLADRLNADGVIASTLEFHDGVCSGYFDGRPMFGREKLRAVREFAVRNSVDLADCSFYSDSIHDLPLLEAVGKPVVVNPDFRLARIAKKRGWETVRGPELRKRS